MLSLLLNQSIIPVYYHKVLNYMNISQRHRSINITQLMRRNNSYYKTCNYSSELEQAVVDLKEEYSRDVDIIRQRVYKVPTDSESSCTLEEELLPPSYRKDVQKMIEIGKTQVNRFTYKFKYNSGLDYYPFQK